MKLSIICCPKQPGNEVDVYLSPLIEEFKLLWEEGVEVLDVFGNESFQRHAMLFFLSMTFLHMKSLLSGGELFIKDFHKYFL